MVTYLQSDEMAMQAGNESGKPVFDRRTSGLISHQLLPVLQKHGNGEVGVGATNTVQTVFIGYHAGDSVTGNAQKANFIGYYAGYGASTLTTPTYWRKRRRPCGDAINLTL